MSDLERPHKERREKRDGPSASADAPLNLEGAIAAFQQAMERLEAAVQSRIDEGAEKSGVNADAGRGPAVAALKAARAELGRLQVENEALRAVGAAAQEPAFSKFENALAPADDRNVQSAPAATNGAAPSAVGAPRAGDRNG